MHLGMDPWVKPKDDEGSKVGTNLPYGPIRSFPRRRESLCRCFVSRKETPAYAGASGLRKDFIVTNRP